MASDPLTPFLKLYKPIVNDEAGEDLWGEKLNTNFDLLDTFASNQGVLNEAPEDGRIYGRQNRSWTETIEKAVYDVDIGEIVADNDAQDVSIAAGAAAITVNTADIDALELALAELDTEVDGKVGEAPDDGGQYVRQSLSWQLVDIPEPLDAYTKPESDARYEPIDTMYTKAESDTRYANVTGDAMTGFLTLHADPTATMHASTKQYVDNKVGTVPAGATISDAPPGGAVSGQFWLESDTGTLFTYWADANSSQWVDVSGSSALGNYLPLSGGQLTGFLTLHAAPDAPMKAATKSYVDTAIAAVDLSSKVSKTGDTMTGLLQVAPPAGAANGYSIDARGHSNAGRGVIGWTAGLTNYGILGHDTSGVYGRAGIAGHSGVQGFTQSGAQYAYLGYNNTYAGYFYGVVEIASGGLNLTAGSITTQNGGVTIGGAGYSLSFSSISSFVVGYNNKACVTTGTGTFEIMTAGTSRVTFAATYTAPTTDNQQYCGLSGNRWIAVYAVAGAINTSDERLKQDIRPLDERERAAAQAIKGLIRAYRWKPGEGPAGDERLYIGVIAQQVEQALIAEGLDANDYAMWNNEPLTRHVDAEMDEDGTLIKEAHEVPTGEYRYSVDYNQILAFIIGGM